MYLSWTLNMIICVKSWALYLAYCNYSLHIISPLCGTSRPPPCSQIVFIPTIKSPILPSGGCEALSLQCQSDHVTPVLKILWCSHCQLDKLKLLCKRYKDVLASSLAILPCALRLVTSLHCYFVSGCVLSFSACSCPLSAHSVLFVLNRPTPITHRESYSASSSNLNATPNLLQAHSPVFLRTCCAYHLVLQAVRRVLCIPSVWDGVGCIRDT